MFIRFKQEKYYQEVMIRTIDMKGVYEIAKHRCGDGTWTISVRYAAGHALLSTMLTEEEANAKEQKLMEAWVSDSKEVLEV